MPDFSVLPTPQAIGDVVSAFILEGLSKAHADGRLYLLGCPTGRTPKPVYEALANAFEQNPRDLSNLRLVMMDEYLNHKPDGSVALANPTAHYSCQRFAEEDIRQVLNRGLSPEFQLAPEYVWFADVNDPAEYEARIEAAGGIDFFILASGASDGHVAFNPPGTAFESETRIVELAQKTRIDNMSSFPDFKDLDEVPTHGISVGVQTLARARNAAMILTGADKHLAYQRILDAGGYDPDWPSSVVNCCPNATLFADAAAAAGATEPSR